MNKWLRQTGLAMCFIPNVVFAQFAPCGVPAPYIATVPLAPFAGQPFNVTVAESNFIPQQITHSVSGNVIDITLTGYHNSLSVAVGTACSTEVVGT